MHGISEGRAVAVEDHQPEGPAPGPGATAPNAPATEAAGPGAPAPEAAGPGAPDTDAVGAAGSVPWGADSIFAPGTEPVRILLSIHHPMLQPVPVAHAARPHHARRRPAADGNP